MGSAALGLTRPGALPPEAQRILEETLRLHRRLRSGIRGFQRHIVDAAANPDPAELRRMDAALGKAWDAGAFLSLPTCGPDESEDELGELDAELAKILQEEACAEGILRRMAELWGTS